MLTAGVPTVGEIRDQLARHAAHVKAHGEIRVHDSIYPLRETTPEEEAQFREIAKMVQGIAEQTALYTNYVGSPLT